MREKGSLWVKLIKKPAPSGISGMHNSPVHTLSADNTVFFATQRPCVSSKYCVF